MSESLGVILPNLNGLSTMGFTICCETLKDPHVNIKKSEEFTCLKNGPRGDVIIRVGNRNDGNAVMVEVILKTESEKENQKIQASNISQEKLQEKLATLVGLELDTCICSFYRTELSQLPEKGLIRSTYSWEKSGEINMRLNGGKMAFEGAPLQFLTWAINNDGTAVKMTLKAKRKCEIKYDFLQSAIEFMEDQFAVFVLGKTNKN